MTLSKILDIFTLVGLCITSVLGTPVSIDTGYVLSRRETSLFSPNLILENCTDILPQVTTAIEEFELLAKAGYDYPTTGDYWKAWFGDEADVPIYYKDNTIKDMYFKFASWTKVKNKNLRIICDIGLQPTTPVCRLRSSISGWADRNGEIAVGYTEERIGLCNGWYNNPVGPLARLKPPSSKAPSVNLLGYYTRGAVLLHEMTHAVSEKLDKKLSGGQAAYGHENTLKLAKESPRQARGNADNYAYFAVAAYFSSLNGARWSTNRDDEL